METVTDTVGKPSQLAVRDTALAGLDDSGVVRIPLGRANEQLVQSVKRVHGLGSSGFLRVHKGCDSRNRVQVLPVGLVCLQRDPETFFQE